MSVSPTKRRALAPLDTNAQSPAPSIKLSQPSEVRPLLSRDAQGSNISSGKRTSTAMEDGDVVAAIAKRQYRAPTSTAAGAPESQGELATRQPDKREDRGPSTSPEPSSIFDSPTVDTSQATCCTTLEAETELPAPLPRRSTMTRSEARQNAEILRLRLGLAGYKLRTGQEHLPLERLQVRRGAADQDGGRHVERAAAALQRGERRRMLPNTSGSVLQLSRRQDALGRESSVSFRTPTRGRHENEEAGLTSSAIRGGAANGLISLSRG